MSNCSHASPPLALDGPGWECAGTWAVNQGRIVCSECDLDYGSFELAAIASFGSRVACPPDDQWVQPTEAEETW